MKGPDQDEANGLDNAPLQDPLQSPLHAPLGQERLGQERFGHERVGRRAGPPPHLSARQLAIGSVAVVVVGLSAFLWIGRDTSGGASSAVAKIERPVADKPANVAAARPRDATAPDVTGSIPVSPRASGPEVEAATGVRVTRGGDGGQAPGGLIIKVPQALDLQLTRAPDRRLIEKGTYGPLPKIGADGARPMQVYARPVMGRTDARADGARIAFMVGGMGLNAALTRAAIAQLPGAVTLGFAPYGNELDTLVEEARAAGHEVILQSPMESFGESDDPGPFVLKTAQDRAQTIGNLHWQMSRFPGYVGISGFLGARFTASDAAFTPVLREIATRGLMYFDDASSPRSLARSLSDTTSTPFAAADLAIESRSGDDIDASLARLEALARDKGVAIGSASGLPVMVERIARFTKTLESRGITLVPVSALATRGQSVSRARR